jgi:hypothetical protein
MNNEKVYVRSFVTALVVLGITVVFGLTIVLMYSSSKYLLEENKMSSRWERAAIHVKTLQLKDPIIECDTSKFSCGCTVSYMTGIGRQVVKLKCCGSGCE